MENSKEHKLRKLFWIGFIKTIYVNLKLLPFRQAIKFPIVVTKKTTFGSLSGKLIIKGHCRFGMIRFGIFHSDLRSWKENRTYLNIQGDLIARGWMQFGVGCKINIDKGAVLEIGDNVCIGSSSWIVCREHIKIGSNLRCAWDVQIMDTNFHYLKNIETGKVEKDMKPIIIGNNNWIGNRSSVMQGTKTPDFFIVASNSICNKDYTSLIPEYSVVGGSPAKLLKTGVCMVLDKEEKEIREILKKTQKDFVIVEKSPRVK